mgnify:CR=1 FL=1
MTTANIIVRKILPGRGNTAVSSTYTGIIGEITVDTGLDTLRVHDGVTAGGTRLATYQEVQDIATGNIDLKGSSRATPLQVNSTITSSSSGNVTLGAVSGVFSLAINNGSGTIDLSTVGTSSSKLTTFTLYGTGNNKLNGDIRQHYAGHI